MLTPKDIATIQADMAGIAADVEVPIIYKVYLSTTPGNAALGIPAQDNYDEQESTATARELTTEEVATSGGVFTLGDMEFGVRRGAVDRRDQIVYGGATWAVKEIRPARLAGVVVKWSLRCKKS